MKKKPAAGRGVFLGGSVSGSVWMPEDAKCAVYEYGRIPHNSLLPFPNMAVIHGILETSDDMLVLTQRARDMHYHPLHWSASFEEGLSVSDLASANMTFHTAAARGVKEELLFEETVGPTTFRLLAVIGEFRYLNPAIVAYARIPYRSSDLLERRSREHRDRTEDEVAELRFVPLDPRSLARLVVAKTFPVPEEGNAGNPWHPTSRYRLLSAMVHRFGEQATVEALRECAPY